MACSSAPPLSTNWSKRTANHFSLRVKGIMVSVVSQMLCQDLNTSDPHHLAATFYLRGLLNTSFSPLPQTILHLQNLGGLSNHLHLSYYPRQYSIPRGLPAIVSIINLSSCLCVASRETHMGGSQHMWSLAL